MLDLENEPAITLQQVAERLPGENGRPRSIRTLYRWCKTGFRGVKLDHRYAGGIIVTTWSAVTRFLDCCTEQQSGPVARTPSQSHHAAVESLRTRHGLT